MTDTRPMPVSLYEWQVEVAKAIRQLSQEVHAMNPGVRYEFNLSVILDPWNSDAGGEE